MHRLFLMITLPLWWVLIVTPDMVAVLRYIFENTDPVVNTIALGMVLVAARFASLYESGQLPTLRRRGEQAEYAVKFEDESKVWDEDND